MCQCILDDLPQIIDHVLGSQPADWWAYHCDNGTQLLDRLSLYWGRYEVQLNQLTHSEQPHCHACNMVSLILVQGYGWYLQMHESSSPVWLFAAPGSIITMRPDDTHWIPRQAVPSLSLCIFDKQSDWHLWYRSQHALPHPVAEEIHSQAIWALRRLKEQSWMALNEMTKSATIPVLPWPSAGVAP